ncbi:MAG: cysteine desulfurase NifS [Planctomycetaceae bacterium]|nr:cysteine desulfurase NifS [Planctomycetaceae bacterium]
MSETYLDHNATTPPLPAVVDTMLECLRGDWANPSSTHREGIAARRRIELARESVARLIGCRPRDLLLCSGGTEAANLALRGSLQSQPDRTAIATSRHEHSAVRETAESLGKSGTTVHWLEHADDGTIDLDALEGLLVAEGDSIAVLSVMWVNNETGVIQPVPEIGRLCREHGVRFHTDAVQAVGRMPVDCASLDVDLLSFAAHKFHGPKGAGGMFVSRGTRLTPEITGGSQERDRRGGTENVAAIAGMGIAADAAASWIASEPSPWQALERRRDDFEAAVREACPEVVVNGGDAPRLWTTSNLGFPRLSAEAVLMSLSERGIAASAGAACASGSLEPSPILLAMGVPEAVAHGSVRFSFSRETTGDEISTGVAAIGAVVARLARDLPAS